MAGAPRKHLISVDEYYRMADVGLLAPDARVELIEGEIIDMVPIGSRHSRAVRHLQYVFTVAVGRRAIVSTQNVVRLDRHSEPQPDLALLAQRADEYGDSHPGPADVLLLIEVSDSTLDYDRDAKLPLYAHHAIPEVWIVDLQHDELHVYRSPHKGRYVDCCSTYQPGMTGVAVLPGVEIDLSRLFQP